MTRDPRDLIDGYFDELLSSEELIDLTHWLKSDSQNARMFAQASLLHDRLRNTQAMQGWVGPVCAIEARKTNRSWILPAFSRTAVAVLVIVCGLAALWYGIGTQRVSAAIRELDRIIASSMRSDDRTYEIVVEDVTTSERRRQRSSPLEVQRPPKPPLDGAILHVRAGNQFVLKRKTIDGALFITGSNGQQSWAVNPRGPVKLSHDVNEFSRDLPGHEVSVPLSNLHNGLEQLKRAYDLHFSSLGPEEYLAEEGANVRLLVAVKKPKERGPQRVEIIYDTTDGQILRMRFVHMPYGPDRLDLRLSLLSHHELPPDFFEHTSHHPTDQQVELENRR